MLMSKFEDAFFNLFAKGLLVFGILGLIVAAGYFIMAIKIGIDDKAAEAAKPKIRCELEKKSYGSEYAYDEECNPIIDDNGNYVFDKNRAACIDSAGSWVPSITNPDGTVDIMKQSDAEAKYKINPENGCIKTDKNGEYIPK